MKEQEKRNADKSWNRFYESGKIEDYLAYVGKSTVFCDEKSINSEWIGEESYAGIYTGNRYYIETDAYR